ncbi:hypothetical protein ACO2Q0_13435 [Phenylobacterium sp. VNQ135]|uniref:hypothetical protein n=1 Tax=Phenylobacterium sp. VNQ135 TaxID=3400922 RepID=UPI003C0D0C0B
MTLYPLPVLIHVAAGAAAIVAGFVALAAGKGGGLHRRAGQTFFAAMLVMAATAGVLSLIAFQRTNISASAFALCLTLSAWSAARQPAGALGPIERFGPAAAFGVAGLSLLMGALPGDPGDAPGVPFVIMALAGLAAVLDLHVVRKGGLAGYPRLRRHVWRVCLALFIAAGSFFLGQQDEMPAAARGSPLLTVPPLTALGALAYWMAKSRPRRRVRPAAIGR